MVKEDTIKWKLRFESLIDGRTFITDMRMLLDEAYYSAGILDKPTPKQMAKCTGLLSAPSTSKIGMEDLVLKETYYDTLGGIHFSIRCVDFLKTLSFKQVLRFELVPSEDDYIYIFDGETKVGCMTPVTYPKERSERARRKHAKKMMENIPSEILEKAEQSEPAAFSVLALYCGFAYDLCSDYGIECLKWTTRAAETGDAQNQYCLGMMYVLGEVVSQDYKLAFKWFQKAAGQGHPKATRQLGLLYHVGYGVPQDGVQGLLLLEQAIDLGDERAIRARALFQKAMSPKQYQAAQKLIAQQLLE